MERAWVAALGNRKGWLIAVGMWAAVIGASCAVPALLAPGRTRVHLDPQLAEVIGTGIDLQSITGGMNQPGDAADDYHQAVQECIASDFYRSILPGAALNRITTPDELSIEGPDHVLAGAARREMHYAERFARPADWTGWSDRLCPYHQALEVVGKYSIMKANLLAKAGRQEEAEALLKAVMVLGYRLQEERVRVKGALTGLGLQRAAGSALLKLYQETGRTDKAEPLQACIQALRRMQGRIDDKHQVIARLVDQSPPAAELIWVVENDKDRMWRIEAILRLGLAKWTAPRTADQEASRHLLEDLLQDGDPLVRQAAETALAITPKDVTAAR